MASGIDYDKAALLASLLECIAYGLFAVHFMVTMYLLTVRQSQPKLDMLLLLSVTIMFSMATIHLVIAFMTAFGALAFVNTNRMDPTLYYASIPASWRLLAILAVQINVLTADAFLSYRCYVVWGRNRWVALVPVICCVGTAASVSGEVFVIASRSGQQGTEDFLAAVMPLSTSAGALTTTTNILCTGLISYKIYSIQRRMRSAFPSSRGVSSLLSHKASIMIIETASVYSAAMVVLFILSLTRSNAKIAVAGIVPSLIGINLTTITIRISLGLSTANGLPVDTSRDSTPRQVVTIGRGCRILRNEIELEDSSRAGSRVDRNVYSETDFKTGDSVV